MHIQDIIKAGVPSFSFEFFPPKTEKMAERLYQTIAELEQFSPSFVSVTYGAGGSTRELTHDLVVRIKQTTTLEPVPHLTCVCHTEKEIEDLLSRYAEVGVGNILALGGDPPTSVTDYKKEDDDFQYASDLVKFINGFDGSKKIEGGFGVGVAGFPEGHPSTPNRIKEMDHLKAKIDQGADYICTQLFFDNRDFYDFRERCALAGINVPIIAGIMPINSLGGMDRMADLAGGARFPAKLLKALNRVDESAVADVGLHYATEQCADLLDNNVAGIHFYTLNQSGATTEIYKRLGLKSLVSA